MFSDYKYCKYKIFIFYEYLFIYKQKYESCGDIRNLDISSSIEQSVQYNYTYFFSNSLLFTTRNDLVKKNGNFLIIVIIINICSLNTFLLLTSEKR